MTPSTDETLSHAETPLGTRPSQAAGYLLHRAGVITLCAILLFAAWNRMLPIVLLMGLFLSAALLARAWSRLCLLGVTCRRSLSETRAFPGEKVNLILSVSNRKPLPLPWLYVDDYLPAALRWNRAGSGAENGLIRRSAALLWYRSIRWTLALECEKRGFYPFGPVEITSGDIFGLYSQSLAWPGKDILIVYPRLLPVRRLPIPPVHPMGGTATEKRVFQDPTRVIGVREYRPGDSPRTIHWKASARAQGLQVKVFEPTTILKVALFLGVDTFHQGDTFKADDFELGIETLASVANDVMDHGGPAGLFVNTRLADTGQGVSIPPSGNRKQLEGILEALAKTTASFSEAFGPFLERERRSLAAGTTLVFVISSPPEDLPVRLMALRESGHQLLVFLIGEQENMPALDGISWVNVRSPMDLVRN